jgi:hypothetical protein
VAVDAKERVSLLETMTPQIIHTFNEAYVDAQIISKAFDSLNEKTHLHQHKSNGSAVSGRLMRAFWQARKSC